MPDASSKVPYLQAYGNIRKVLEKIQQASTPPKFTQDFLATTLDMSGGSARPVIAYLKRADFLGSDGAPTDLYKQFKNPSARGAAAAQGLRKAYSALYEVNEYVHDAKDRDLKGIILQVTGLEENSKLVIAMVGSFKTFRAFADFTADPVRNVSEEEAAHPDDNGGQRTRLNIPQGNNLQLGYTINLNLPATTEIAVFNAIFKSLREHLL
jgi:hypothetical protein